MPTSLKVIRLLALTALLALFAGCATSPAPSAPPEIVETSTTTPQKGEEAIATLTVDAASVPLHAAPSMASPVVATASSGDRLVLLERMPEWLRVKSYEGLTGFVQPSALVAPECTSDRAEPRVLEEPLFRFEGDRRLGRVVIEAEFDAAGQLIATRVLSNSTRNPAFEQTALAELKGLRFLPPTKDCKPRPFFYTFTREF